MEFEPTALQMLQIPDHPLVNASIRELRGSRILVLDHSGDEDRICFNQFLSCFDRVYRPEYPTGMSHMDSGNIHSIWKPGTRAEDFMTKSVWDFLATLPTLSPAEGTIGE